MSRKKPDFDRKDLSGFIGKHLVYTYDNGWKYEIYVKTGHKIDYRIHSGIVGNRWVKDQFVYTCRVGPQAYKVCWSEPTGTCVSLLVNLEHMIFHGTIFFPRWVVNDPQKTVCFQNDSIPLMESHRDKGPTYPIEVIEEFATIMYINDVGPGKEDVIACPASELPKDFPRNLPGKFFD